MKQVAVSSSRRIRRHSPKGNSWDMVEQEHKWTFYRIRAGAGHVPSRALARWRTGEWVGEIESPGANAVGRLLCACDLVGCRLHFFLAFLVDMMLVDW